MSVGSFAKPSTNSHWGRAQGILVVLLIACLALLFRKPGVDLANVWFTSPEYNYAPIVPLIALLMIWRDMQRSEAGLGPRVGGGWTGVVLASIGFAAGVVGTLSQTQFIGQFGLFLAVIGGLIAFLGERQARIAWPGILFLFFALPLASVVQFDLTWAMQLVATKGGVALIQLFGIPVFREGNIIDLGQFQLQVAEACSGLRYLCPLACFSYLCAYLFSAGPILRAIVFVSALPITVLMNIVRIAITGYLVDRIGLEAAQGFFHDFEGWAVFCLCLAVLFLEMKLLCLIDGRGRSLLARLDITLPEMRLPAGIGRQKPMAPAALLGLGILALGAAAVLGTREPTVLARTSFAEFPTRIGDWQSMEVPLDDATVQTLNATDYLSRNYHLASGEIVNVFSAYYESQKSGTAIHSPQVCIPGGGWEIEQIREIPNPSSVSGRLIPEQIIRLIIRRGSDRQLIYYWFEIGGRATTNEYTGKLQMFINAITENRTDGGIVRFVTPILPHGGEHAADERLADFLGETVVSLDDFLP